MSCRDSRLSSAMVTFVRDMTGLEDNQILSMNHALMQEGNQYPNNGELWNETIDRIQEEYRNGQLQITGHSRDPLSRLEAARLENPDGRRIYAAENLMRRATLAQEAHTEYLVNAARDMGYSMNQIQTMFNTVFAEATRDSSLHADAEFTRRWNEDPTNTNLFQDRRTQYVYQQIENERRAIVEAQPSESVIRETYTYNNPFLDISEIRYDDVSGYTEVQSRDGIVTERYCLPVDVARQLTSSSDPAQYIMNNVATFSLYRYANEQEAREAGITRRCATCGQYRNSFSHNCPVPGSPQAIEAEVRQTVARAVAPTASQAVTAAPSASPSTLVPVVTRVATPDSTAIAEIGYDPAASRLEVVMRSNPDNVYSYRMPSDEYAILMESDSIGAYFARNIRGNPSYAYADSEHAENMRYRCTACGQFCNSSHVCSVTAIVPDDGLDPEVASMIGEWDTELSSYLDDETFIPPEFAQTAEPFLVSQGRNQRYDINNTYIRMAGLNRLRQLARNQTNIAFPVFASNVAMDATVSGLAEITYNGRGQGYSISTVSGLDIDRRLRCTCVAYQTTRECQHVQDVQSNIADLFNNVQAATPAEATTATSNVTSTMDRALAASLEASRQAEERFKKVSVSFSENPEEFQTLYEEYRQKKQAYAAALAAGQTDAEYPVPYMRENAFGGLGTRESGRGLGIEIEFAFPRDMGYEEMREARQAIGEELYAEGLTRTEHQGGYGASHGWTRDHHERGWSYEDDGTTGGSDAYSGGEIVSPIMYDEPETWTNLEKITKVLKKHGAVVSKGSGLHVHASIGDYDHRIDNHNRLISAFAENEDLIYRLSSNPERGRHRGTGYCSPNDIPSSPYAEVDRMRRRNVGHHIALNMQSVAGRGSDHVEFRTFDSSLNPAVIQAQMGLALYMSEGALRDGTADVNPGQNRNRLGARIDANPERQNLSGDAWNESTAGVRKFIDTFVPGSDGDEKENPRVQQIVSLFAMTRWQRKRRNANY